MKQKSNSLNKEANHPLQTWEWGEFRKAWGNKIVRFDFGQVTLHKVPFTKFKIGTFLKGPRPTEKMLDNLKRFAKENDIIFIKIEPSEPFVITRNPAPQETKQSQAPRDRRASPTMTESTKLLKENNCVPGKTLFTPTTFWINLTKSEDELMKRFSSKTRYNIRLAKRKGVEVIEDNSDKAFEKYIQLTKETVERQGFYAHTEKYHRLMWKHLHQDMVTKKKKPIAHLLTAIYRPPSHKASEEQEGEIITTWILFVWKNFLYYPYGASSHKHKNVMANNLMMWEAIRFGKKLGLKTFDLWGREPSKGFTKFKEGYNPQVVQFLGTWDLVTSPLYYPYRLAEEVRWKFLKTLSKLPLYKPRF